MDESAESATISREDTTTTENTPRYRETDNAKVFLQRFMQSDTYRKYFDKFYEGKTLSPKVTEQLMRDVFENSDLGMMALYNFFMNDCRFSYNPMRYPYEVNTAVKDYIKAVDEFRKVLATGDRDRDAYANADVRRVATHLKASDAFMDAGIVHTRRQGEFLARVIVVQNGLEKPAYLKPEESLQRVRVDAYQNGRRSA
jgi:hypothetical protein